MFKPLLTRLLDHLISQNQWARAELLPFAGKTVRFNLIPTSVSFTILEDGRLVMAGDTAQSDASISITPSVALRMLAGDAAAQSQVKIEGDIELATTFAKVIRGIKWDYEEDLSRVIGDIPATKISEFSKHVVKTAKQQTTNLAEMLTEYWQEEQPLIAKKRHVEQFVQEVDQVRDDVARLEKRLAKLH